MQEQREPRDPSPIFQAWATVLTVLINALSERMFAFMRESLPLVAIGCALVMFLRVMDSPTPQQLVGLGLFGVFSTVLVLIVKRR